MIAIGRFILFLLVTTMFTLPLHRLGIRLKILPADEREFMHCDPFAVVMYVMASSMVSLVLAFLVINPSKLLEIWQWVLEN